MWLTGLLFGLLAIAAIAVFAVLPDWVQSRQLATTAKPVQAEPAPMDSMIVEPDWDQAAPTHTATIESASTKPTPTEPALAEPVLTEPAATLPPEEAASTADISTAEARSPRESVPTPRQASRPAAKQSLDPEFQRAMTEGLAALDRQDYAAARDAFSRATNQQPTAPQSIDGLARAEQGLRLQNIETLRQEAIDLESREDWHAATERYRAVLAIDSTVKFAQDGHDRSHQRAELSDRLQSHIENPARLSSEAVLAEAKAQLDHATSINPAGPRLRRQMTELSTLVTGFSTPVQATFESDNLTDVVIYKVGRLGAFDRRTLDLRPGTYTVVGSRRGYRDVRQRLEITPGVAPQPLAIRCEEKI